MSDTLETPIPPLDDNAEREARADAAKMTRIFLMFAAPMGLMFIILLGAMAWKFSHSKPLVTTPPPAAASSSNDKDAEIARLKMQLAALQNQTTSAASATPQGAPVATPPAVPAQTAPSSPAESSNLAQLTARMDRLEANQKELAHAAGAAYAARNLQLAAHDGDPFLSELAAAEPSIDDSSLTNALRPYAEHGVPSEITLAVRFPAAAEKANIAAETHSGKTGFFNWIAQAFGSFISIRRTDNPTGQGTEAILARAENRLNLGDLHGAVGYLSALPPAAHQAMKPWLDDAQARLLVDDTTRRISEEAIDRLGRSATSAPAAAASPPDGGLL